MQTNTAKVLKPLKSLLLPLVLAYCILGSQTLFAQNKEQKQQTEQTPADSTSERYFIVGASWGNNSSFLGRNQAERLPFFSTDLSYISKKGFWLSGIAYHVMNTANTVDEVDLTMGWSFYPSDRIDAALYYSKFFFSPESTLLKAATGNAASGYIGLDWTVLYSRLTSTVTFGGSTDFFLILDNSRYFSTGKLLHKSDSLSIEPRVSLIAGTQTFVESHMGMRPTPDYSPVSGPGRPGAGGGTPQQEGSTSSFNVLNYELAIPVTYSIGNLSLEVVPRYSIPVNQLEGSEIPPQLFLTTSLYYVFRSRQ